MGAMCVCVCVCVCVYVCACVRACVSVLQAWSDGGLSNLGYLMSLNALGGRRYGDRQIKKTLKTNSKNQILKSNLYCVLIYRKSTRTLTFSFLKFFPCV